MDSAATDTAEDADPADDVISVGWRHGKKQADPRYRVDIDIGNLDGVRVMKLLPRILIIHTHTTFL